MQIVMCLTAAQKDLSHPAPEPWHELVRTDNTIQMLKCPSPETPL